MKKLDTANSLITYFLSAYTKKTGSKAIVNRAKMKFSVTEILQDWSQSEVREFIDYYVKTETKPDLADFCRRYDEIIRDMRIEQEDKKDRIRLMNETKNAVIKFREQFGNAKRD